jgi:hypothetical protein
VTFTVLGEDISLYFSDTFGFFLDKNNSFRLGDGQSRKGVNEKGQSRAFLVLKMFFLFFF